MTKEATIERLCALVREVHNQHDPKCQNPCDCFCSHATGLRFASDGAAVKFIEETVRQALDREKNP